MSSNTALLLVDEAVFKKRPVRILQVVLAYLEFLHQLCISWLGLRIEAEEKRVLDISEGIRDGAV